MQFFFLSLKSWKLSPFCVKETPTVSLRDIERQRQSFCFWGPLGKKARATWRPHGGRPDSRDSYQVSKGQDALDKGAIHVLGGRAGWDEASPRFLDRHTALWIAYFWKTYGLFISGNFHLIFLDHGWPRVTGTVGSETTDDGGYCTRM